MGGGKNKNGCRPPRCYCPLHGERALFAAPCGRIIGQSGNWHQITSNNLPRRNAFLCDSVPATDVDGPPCYIFSRLDIAIGSSLKAVATTFLPRAIDGHGLPGDLLRNKQIAVHSLADEELLHGNSSTACGRIPMGHVALFSWGMWHFFHGTCGNVSWDKFARNAIPSHEMAQTRAWPTPNLEDFSAKMSMGFGRNLIRIWVKGVAGSGRPRPSSHPDMDDNYGCFQEVCQEAAEPATSWQLRY